VGRHTTIILVGLVVFVSSCSGGPARCSAIRFAEAADADLHESAATLDFEPLPPCAFRSGFEVVRVFVAMLPGSQSQPRISFIVSRNGERAFILSETRAEVPFTAIPQSTHRLTTSVSGVTASGFAGPAGTGEDIAYLRWRVGGVTYELSATLRPGFTEHDVQKLAGALIELHAATATGGTGPSPSSEEE